MRNLALVFVAALALAGVGCKKKDAGGADCGAAIHHSMDLSRADMQKMGVDDKTLQKMTELGIQRCKDDKWSVDAIKCMVDAQTMNDAQACYGKLTPEQQAKMNKAAMEAAPTPPASGTAGETGSASGGSSAAPQ